MISQTVIDQARQTNLVSIAERYTTLRKESSREWSGPCPKCPGGGVDRFHVKPDGWFCRKCHPEFADQIEFIRWVDGADFVTAIERLTGQQPMQATIQRKPVVRMQTATKPVGWLDDAEMIVDTAHARLMAGDNPGTDYLLGRGLQPATWTAFSLGYREDVSLPGTGGKYKAPAIVLPWTRGGKLTAIRYRFLTMHEYTDLESQPRKAKQTSLADSDFTGVLYGGQGLLGCAEDLRTLVLCEGEINALSVWQTCHSWNWDVLSLGSENAKLTPAAIEYAQKFNRVIVWMDDADVAKSIMAVIPGAYGISSKVEDGKKQDANERLKQGLLGGLLATARFQACQTDAEHERLLWDIWDSAQMPNGIDDGTKQVMESIAKGLGRTVWHD